MNRLSTPENNGGLSGFLPSEHFDLKKNFPNFFSLFFLLFLHFPYRPYFQWWLKMPEFQKEESRRGLRCFQGLRTYSYPFKSCKWFGTIRHVKKILGGLEKKFFSSIFNAILAVNPY